MGKLATLVVLCVSQCVIFTCADLLTEDDTIFSTQHENPELYCEAYCNSAGYFTPGQTCISDHPDRPIYCCGDQYYRECCYDPDQDVGDRYPPVTSCTASSWWYYQWRIIVGLLTSLIVILVCAACCYYCCSGDVSHTRQRAANLFGRSRPEQCTGTDDTATTEGNDNPMDNFDPCSPNAFSPPAYESLPKEPPKYVDIFGQDNAAFANDAETSFANENPPDYAIESEIRNRTNETHSANPGEASGGSITPVETPDSDSLVDIPLNEETTEMKTGDDVLSSAL